MTEIARRSRIDLMTPVERKIREAVLAVEALGADVRLTAAVNCLEQARSRVADFVDGVDLPTGPEYGWIIESWRSEPSRPAYWTGSGWDFDNLRALRFAREIDAVKARTMLPGLRPQDHRVIEHGWG